MLFNIKRVLLKKASKEWRRLLEQPRRLVGLFNRAQLVVFGHLSKGNCLAILSMSRSIHKIYKRSGPLFLAQYLKQASNLVCWYVGSKGVTPIPELSLCMKLTKSGLPCIIPSCYRKRIRKGDLLAVRLVLSVFSFYRLLKVGKKGWRRVDHRSIHHPKNKYQPSQETVNWCKTLLTSSGSLLAAYTPNYREIPLNLGFSWEPVYTSGPNTYKTPKEFRRYLDWLGPYQSYAMKRFGKAWKEIRYNLTVFHTLPVDATALMTLWTPEFLSSVAAVWYSPRVHMPDDGYSAPVKPEKEGVEGFNWLLLELLIPVAEKLWWGSIKTRPELGRFGLTLEGAGKVRTFAIPSPLLQRLVKPLHDWEMAILRQIEMDGTYDQLKPLMRLQGKNELYCFDLKSATDLFPATLSGSMLSGLFGDDLGLSWYQLMNMTPFRSPEKCGSPLKARIYRFTRGQPLGFYSSWPSFALTHHMVVWLAAWKVLPGKRFKDYALLGDDIVIAHRGVAEEYESIMVQMGGVINRNKSLISHNGCCEFAKRFYVNFHKKNWTDCSPVSSACLILSYTNLAASTFSDLKCSFKNTFRLKGAGYRVLARVDRSQPEKVFDRLSRRWKRHWLSTHSSCGVRPLPFKLWLAFPEKGGLTCYEIGIVRELLLRTTKPRDIDENSISLVREFWHGHEDTFERFLSSFVDSYLKSLKRYYRHLLDPYQPIEDLLNVPESPCRLERMAEDRTFCRYGIIYKCWDLLRSKRSPLPLSELSALGPSSYSQWVDKPFVVQVFPPFELKDDQS